MWWRSLPVSFDGSGPSDPNVVNTEEERAMVRSHSRSRRPLGSVALGMSAVLAWYSCGGEPRDVTAPESRSPSVSLQPLEQGFERARAAQERHTSRLLAIKGVTGTAVGFANDGRAVVTIFTKAGGIHGLPASLDDVPVVVAVTGELLALRNSRRGGVAPRDFAPPVLCPPPPAVTPTGEFCPPVPIGVSTGNVTAADCATGTIAARVKGTGTVTGINASVLVGYGSGQTALFVHQIVFENSGLPVIGAGDSGSLLVTADDSHSAVGLLFAGNTSGSMAIGNPIGAVLTRFGVMID